MDNVPLSVEETRAEPAQSSVRPCSLTHEEECVWAMMRMMMKSRTNLRLAKNSHFYWWWFLWSLIKI